MNFKRTCHRVAAALLLAATLAGCAGGPHLPRLEEGGTDRKSTRLNSSH